MPTRALNAEEARMPTEELWRRTLRVQVDDGGDPVLNENGSITVVQEVRES